MPDKRATWDDNGVKPTIPDADGQRLSATRGTANSRFRCFAGMNWELNPVGSGSIRVNIPLDTLLVISGTIFPASCLTGAKLGLNQIKLQPAYNTENLNDSNTHKMCTY